MWLLDIASARLAVGEVLLLVILVNFMTTPCHARAFPGDMPSHARLSMPRRHDAPHEQMLLASRRRNRSERHAPEPSRRTRSAPDALSFGWSLAGELSAIGDCWLWHEPW